MKKFNFPEIKKTVNDLQGHINALRHELDRLKVERKQVASFHAAREDVKAYLVASIERKKGSFSRIFGDIARNLASRPDRLNRTADANLLTATYPGITPTSFTMEDAICALFEDALKQGIAAAIDATSWDADALPIKDRAARLEALDTRIKELETEEAELRRYAYESGLTIL